MRIFVQMTACLCLLALAACDDSSDAKSGSDKVISTEGLVDASTESVEMNIRAPLKMPFSRTVGLESG